MTASRTRANNQAETIVKAAAQLVAEQGVHKLTIESVARQAGLSKGGVLYHYPTKQALLTGMLDELINTMQARRDKAGEVSGLEAMLRTLALDDDSDRPLSLAILAVSAQQPELLSPAKDYYKDRIREINREATDEDMAGILLLALEGMRLLNMLDINPWSKSATRRILKKMHQLGEEISP